MSVDKKVIQSTKIAALSVVNGYKGIWYDIGQNTRYGPKYSGGFATYTVKHRPLAVYSAEAKKTFFTYGGTLAADLKHLVIMAGTYDHVTHKVSRPTMVMDKAGVDDPHDNPAIQMDQSGYLYVFVSGRNESRPGFIYKSSEPFSTASFKRLSPEAGEHFTYPQVWYLPGNSEDGPCFAHFFTRYTRGRELHFSTSLDAREWSEPQKLAALNGHYQVSHHYQNRLGTAFNRHPNGNVDQRTDLYYMQSDDLGKTWTTIDGSPLEVPVREDANPARVIDYASQGRLVYVKDMAFDADGYPVILYLTAASYAPGPEGEPRCLEITCWNGVEWVTTQMPPSVTGRSAVIHNYSAAALRLDGTRWTVVAPTGPVDAPVADAAQEELERYWGQGGEMELWISEDRGESWVKQKTITKNSSRKHGYPRTVEHAEDPFCYFWTDGDPARFSEAHLYFGNRDGTQYWELPYAMAGDADWVEPMRVK